jgi:hypothetical protein
MLEGDWACHSSEPFFVLSRASRFQIPELVFQSQPPQRPAPEPQAEPNQRCEGGSANEQLRTKRETSNMTQSWPHLKPQPCSSAAHMAFAPRRPPIRDSSRLRGVRDDKSATHSLFGTGARGSIIFGASYVPAAQIPCRAISYAVCSAKALSLLELRCFAFPIAASSLACPSHTEEQDVS